MVAAWKLKDVDELAKKMAEFKAIALINIEGIPSRQFQAIRKELSGKAEIRVGKNTLIARALKKAGIKGLDRYIEGSSGLIFTNLNPFKLNRIVKENKAHTCAKEGDIAPEDIVIPAGDTQLAPGPIIGDLQEAGIKSKIDGGKIVVTRDSLVVRKGERINKKVANILSRLGVEPMEIGLNLRAIYEDNMIYTDSVLDIDEKWTISRLINAHQSAFNLAYNLGIINKETIKPLLQNSFINSLTLALKVKIINKETIKILISDAEKEMLSVASRIPDGLDDELKSIVGVVSTDEGVKTDHSDGEVIEKEEDAAVGLADLFG